MYLLMLSGLSTQVRGISVCFHGNITFQQHGSTKSRGINKLCYFRTNQRREGPDYASLGRAGAWDQSRPRCARSGTSLNSIYTCRIAAVKVARDVPSCFPVLSYKSQDYFIISGALKPSSGPSKSISHHSLGSGLPKPSRFRDQFTQK